MKGPAAEKGYPVEYRVGLAFLDGMWLEVGPGCLIPRPETALVVEAGWEEILRRRGPRNTGEDPLRIADAGTGSGAIARLLARRLAAAGLRAEIYATDISPEAWRYACRNLKRLESRGVRVHILLGDWLSPLERLGLAGRLDLVVSNPPYIEDLRRQPNWTRLRHEPAIALDGGRDGLSAYRRLIPQAARFLKPEGAIVLEISGFVREGVLELMREAGFRWRWVKPDSAGRPRVAVGHR